MKKNRTGMKRREAVTGFLFVLPFIIGYTLFTTIPALGTFLLSFFDINTFKKMNNIAEARFVGIENFISIFHDSSFLSSLGRTFEFMIFYVPVLLVMSLALALLLNQNFYCKRVSTTLIFLPYVTNVAAVGLIVSLFFQPYDGPVNALLRLLGVENPPMWLASSKMALPLTAVVSAWHGVAFQTIIFLVALKNVNKELYESAEMDGCNGVQRFFKITLPMISPTTFTVLITAVIQSFGSYSLIANLTGGGPGEATTTLIYNIVTTTFSYNKYSFAAAQALVQFAIIMLITLFQWGMQKKWVHY